MDNRTSEKERKKHLKRQYLEQNDPQWRYLQWFKTSQSLDLAKLKSVDPDEREWHIVAVVLSRLPRDGSAESHALSELPPGPHALFVTWHAEADIMNGGFEQLFFNQSPSLWLALEAAYRWLELPSHSEMAASAVRKQETGASDFTKENRSFHRIASEATKRKAMLIDTKPEMFTLTSITGRCT